MLRTQRSIGGRGENGELTVVKSSAGEHESVSVSPWRRTGLLRYSEALSSGQLAVVAFFVLFLRCDLTVWPRLALNLTMSLCLNLLSSRDHRALCPAVDLFHLVSHAPPTASVANALRSVSVCFL